MNELKKEQIEELYDLYTVRSGYMTEHMEYGLTDEARAIKAFKKSKEMDKRIDEKWSEIGKRIGVGTAYFAEKLLNAVYPKSISRYMQCLTICGVGVEE